MPTLRYLSKHGYKKIVNINKLSKGQGQTKTVADDTRRVAEILMEFKRENFNFKVHN